MNKSRLAELIVNPSSCTNEEAQELNNLAKEFHYSAAIHILNAKIVSFMDPGSKDIFLANAAICSSDRGRLKQYMTSDEIFKNYRLASDTSVENGIIEDQEQKMQIEAEATEVTAEIIVVEEMEAPAPEPVPEEPAGPENEEKMVETDVRVDEPVENEELSSTVTEVIQEPEQEILELPKAVIHEIDIESLPRESDGNSNLAEELMDNLAAYRELREKFNQLYPDDPKEKKEEANFLNTENEISDVDEKFKEIIKPIQKKKSSKKLAKEEQDQLINKFIETDSDKPKPAKTLTGEKQLSEDLSLASSELNEEMLTETLANILVKQGKLEKAIDIYRKLIWKLPQKKAYFAAKIESLKERISKK